MTTDRQPLVYACSGCSNIAQLANRIAVDLDREGLAEMSCIAGVGGGVPALVRKAHAARQDSRRIIALDGCHLHCVKHCLAKIDVTPDAHLTLTELGIRKRHHQDCSNDDYALAREAVAEWLAR